MTMGMGFGMEVQQQMRASPALVALNSMLVLSTQELHQLMEQELADNPALEQVEAADIFCDVCGRLLHEGICFACLRSEHDIRAAAAELTTRPERDVDPLLSVPAPLSAIEALSRDLRTTVSGADYPIAEYLIGSLDGRGFLECDLAEAALQLQVPIERVAAVLSALQEIGPPGLGARSMRECLLLQIDRMEPRDDKHALLRLIVAEHWDDFAAHRYTELSRLLTVSYDTLVQVRDLIRSRLQPYPLASEEGADIQAAPLPDVLISAEGDGFVVEIAESRRYALRLNPLYQELTRAVGRGQAEATEQECEHLRSHVARARLFLKNIRHRRETIRRISEYVVARQEPFLRHGIRQLQPLTRTEVGEALSLNESTVSRATANKFVLLPSREVIPYGTFFHASLSVKDVLKELVNSEAQPLTDEELVEMLRARGFDLARRTVAKYRGQLGIPPSTLR